MSVTGSAFTVEFLAIYFFFQEELILEIVNNVKCEPKIHKHSYLRSTLVLICVTAMVTCFHIFKGLVWCQSFYWVYQVQKPFNFG